MISTKHNIQIERNKLVAFETSTESSGEGSMYWLDFEKTNLDELIDIVLKDYEFKLVEPIVVEGGGLTLYCHDENGEQDIIFIDFMNQVTIKELNGN